MGDALVNGLASALIWVAVFVVGYLMYAFRDFLKAKVGMTQGTWDKIMNVLGGVILALFVWFMVDTLFYT